jgi:hypothetical protein
MSRKKHSFRAFDITTLEQKKMKASFWNRYLLFLPILLLLPTEANALWTKTEHVNDCTFYKGEQQGELVPTRAVCEWPIAPEKLQALIEPADLFDEILSGVSISKLVPSPSEVTRVLQVYSYPGMTDRAGIIDYRMTLIPSGKRYDFQKAENQSSLSKKYVEVEKNTGFWEVTASQEGSLLIFENLYAPGGYVPSFLIRWFQGAGIRGVLEELRKFAEHKP